MRRSPLLILVVFALVAGSCSWETQDFEISIPEQSESTDIFARDGSKILTLVAPENRVSARELDEIPEIIQQAVVAIEDERFYKHDGIDLKAIIRAARSNVAAGGISQGGSTLTQQYVKLAIIQDTEQTASRKMEELWTAVRLEDEFGKDFILLQYLNTVYFGQGAYGVVAAAQTYFNKSLDQVTTAEAAMLAGLVQLPSSLNPFRNYNGALDRSHLVLDTMLRTGYILDSDDYQAARSQLGLPLLTPEDIEEHRVTDRIDLGLTEAQSTELRTVLQEMAEERHAEAMANPPVLQEQTERGTEEYEAAYFVEEVKQWFLDNPEFGETRQDRENLLFTGGLDIHTTVDLDLQRSAEAAVEALLPYRGSSYAADGANPDAAAVTTDPRTGEVLAMVGGRDFFADVDEFPFAKVNLATGKGRQAGSAMKPIGIATYLQTHRGKVTQTIPAPSTIELDLPGVPRPWRVKGGGGGGTVTLVQALRKSMNTVFAQLIANGYINPESFVAMAHDLGIESDIQPVHAAILGTEDVNMLEMSTVYSTIANQGVRIDPVFVSRIVNSDGTIFWEPDVSEEPNRVLDVQVANQIAWVMEGVIAPGGTGTAAEFGRPAAGKTGTAQNFADATFVGYTPQRVTTVWVGYPEGQIPMVPPQTDRRVFGGTYPAEIWREIMVAAHEGLPVEEFPIPPPSSLAPTTLPPVSEQPVPSVLGLTVDEAEAALAAEFFGITTILVESNIYESGQIFTQSPLPGATLPTGTAVVVEVAIPPVEIDDVVIPSVVGLSEAEARQLLASDGFGVATSLAANPDDPTVSPGTVWMQDPAAAELARPLSVVTIWVQPDPNAADAGDGEGGEDAEG